MKPPHDVLPVSRTSIIRCGRRCLLRRVVPEDLDPFFDWYRDERIQRYLANPWWDPTLSRSDYERFRFKRYLDHDASGGVMTICDLSGIPLGLVNYFDYLPEQHSCEVGIIVGVVARWRQGIALEALQLMLDFLSTELQISRVDAQILEENIASQLLFEKAGFRRIGVAPEGNYVFLKYLWEAVPDR